MIVIFGKLQERYRKVRGKLEGYLQRKDTEIDTYRDVIVATTMFISCVLSGYRLANVAKRHIVTDIKVNLISLLPRYVKICC